MDDARQGHDAVLPFAHTTAGAGACPVGAQRPAAVRLNPYAGASAT